MNNSLIGTCCSTGNLVVKYQTWNIITGVFFLICISRFSIISTCRQLLRAYCLVECTVQYTLKLNMNLTLLADCPGFINGCRACVNTGDSLGQPGDSGYSEDYL